MSSYGRIKEFCPEEETVESYLERIELFFIANEIADEKKVAVFLSVIGSKTYTILRSLVAPAKPSEKGFDVLKAELKKHFEPSKIVIAERFHFHRRSQRPEETISEFLAELRRLATHCSFGDFLNDALRDRLVCGLRSESIQRKLLSQRDLTLTQAVDIAKGMEAATRDSHELQGQVPNIQAVRSSSATKKSSGSTQGKPCYRCGKKNHLPQQCHFKEAVCHKCNKKGHISKACKSPVQQKSDTTSSTKPRKKTQWLQTDDTSDSETELPVLRINSKSSHPIRVEVKINGKLLQMEVDTGAAVSIISEQTKNRLNLTVPLASPSVVLRTYTGEAMSVLGEMKVEVEYKDQHYNLTLMVVKGDGPNLFGRDWLQYFQLDWKTIGIATLDKDLSQVQLLKNKYKQVFAEGLGTMKKCKAHLRVKSEAKPVFHRPRSVPYAIKETIEKEIERLEKDGIIEKVEHSEWAAPIVPVPKGDGQIRICGDYKVTVNANLEVDQHPLPKPEDLFTSLSGGQKFSKLDLKHAYQQMMLDSDSRKYVTINTHKGLYCYTRLPFGIASAPAIFQRAMDSILQGIPQVLCYLDDILITGASKEDHLRNLEKVLSRLQEYGIRVNANKCVFMQSSVEYLGHIIDCEGLHTSPKKVKAIQEAPTPRNQQELRSFLGLLHYYGKFIQNLATMLHPLNELLKKGVSWKWSKDCANAFKQAKKQLSSTTVLAHYDPKLPLRLAGDASSYGIGAVISHILPDGSERPISYASRTLSTSERNYAQLEKEALSLVYGVQKFHSYLYGRSFTLYTDHKPLTAIFGSNKSIPPLAAARLQRWALLLAGYNYRIVFRPTQAHANADSLSRLPLPHSEKDTKVPDAKLFNIQQIETLPVTSAQLKTATNRDPILSKVLRYTKRGWPTEVPDTLKPFWYHRSELSIEGNCILRGTRVIVPSKLREEVLKELHRSHIGIVRMKMLARSYVWWPKLDSEIEKMVKSCIPCQETKNAPAVAPLHPWIWPMRPWQRIHIDFAGPMNGQSFLIVVDSHSKWPEVIEMKSTTATATIKELRRLFAMYGLPEQLVSDNGPQFTSADFAGFMKANGIKHIRCAPYHPSSNGCAERFVQTFKKGISSGGHRNLSKEQQLMSFLLTYRTSPHSTTGVSPCKLFLNRELRTRLDLLFPDVRRRVEEKQENQMKHHDSHARARDLTIGQRVMVRNFRAGPHWIPGTVVKQNGPLTYLVKVRENQVWKRHIDHVRQMEDTPRELLRSNEQSADSNMTENEFNDASVTDDDFTDEIADAHTRETTGTAAEPVDSDVRRYPQRTRRPPDRLIHQDSI